MRILSNVVDVHGLTTTKISILSNSFKSKLLFNNLKVGL